MPNKYGQVVKEDYIAPAGCIWAIVQSMEDGEIEIVADFASSQFFHKFLEMFQYDEEWVATICNTYGVVRHNWISMNNFNENQIASNDDERLLVYANTKDGREFIGFFHRITWAERLRRYLDLNHEIYEKGKRI